jgi:predicted O-methyltransferase YrrM
VTDPISPAAEAYAFAHTTPFTGALSAAAEWTADHMPSPEMMAGGPEARLLEALIVAGGARRVLEIGTFTGVGALAMAAALPDGGRLTTLEVDTDAAAIAQRHFDASPYRDRIELIIGDALTTLAQLDGPFDLVWIDAWKPDYPAYYDAVVPKLSPRGVIAADNLFYGGSALRPESADAPTLGIREFARRVQADERVRNVLLTIGDGVMLAWPAPRA